MTVREAFAGHSASDDLIAEGDRDDLLFHSIGPVTRAAALAELIAATADIIGSQKRVSADVDEVADGIWAGRVLYEQIPVLPQFSFDTTGGTAHITQSLGQQDAVKADGVPEIPDLQGAIGVNGDRVEGTDITVPALKWEETHYFDPSNLTAAYKKTVARLTGTMNDAPFKGFAAHEVLFLGVRASWKATDVTVPVNFAFASEENAAGLALDGLPAIDKDGWNYLWVMYDDEEDAAAKQLVKRAIAAFVDQVYREGDLSLLGIGV